MHRPTAPYVVPWTGETIPSQKTVVSSRGVAYADPVLDGFHRDRDGILWTVSGGTRTGSPEYARELHPSRQKVTMQQLLCAGCGGPASRDERGMLWVLPLLDDAEDRSWENVRTVIPPMCEVCSTKATQLCPRLRDGHVELRVQEAEKIGVQGTLYPRPGEPGEPDPDALVLYDSQDQPFVIARQLVRELRQVAVAAVAPPAPQESQRDHHPS